MILSIACREIATAVKNKESVRGEKRMIKIRCKINYQDKITKHIRNAGEEYIETNERAKEIINKGYAIFIEEIIEEAVVDVEKETARKKSNAKK